MTTMVIDNVSVKGQSVVEVIPISNGTEVKYQIILADVPYAALLDITPTYEKVYESDIKVDLTVTNIGICEALFTQFNGEFGFPNDYENRSLSVGDRVRLIRGGITTTYEVVNFGWLELK